jgi:hypothetical protein
LLHKGQTQKFDRRDYTDPELQKKAATKKKTLVGNEEMEYDQMLEMRREEIGKLR